MVIAGGGASTRTSSRSNGTERTEFVLITDQMRGHLAPVRANAVLPDIDSLPRAERQTASDERYGYVDRRQRSAHVRRHVVVAFLAMTEQRIAVRHEPREEAL